MNRRASVGFSVGATLEKIAEAKNQNAEISILHFDF
jgi:hypothetical protein